TPAKLPISSAPHAPSVDEFEIDAKHPSRVISGVRFLHAITGGAGGSHSIETNVYRTFKNDMCFELSIHVTLSVFAVYEPGTINEFTRHDAKTVTEELTRVLDSFRILR
nr:hypothetical protein [Acidobacteriota bacterium]